VATCAAARRHCCGERLPLAVVREEERTTATGAGVGGRANGDRGHVGGGADGGGRRCGGRRWDGRRPPGWGKKVRMAAASMGRGGGADGG